MNKLKFLSILTLLCAFSQLRASNTLDSLRSSLKTAQNDTTKAKLLRDIGTIYMDNGNYPEAIEYLLKSENLFVSSKNEHGVFDCQNRLGVTYSHAGDYKTALDYLLKCKMGIDDGRVYDNLALVYYQLNDYDKALLYYNQALNFYRIKSDKSPMARLLNGVGSIYEFRNNIDTAISYYLQSLKVSEELNDKISIVDALASLGDAYFKKQQFSKSLEYEHKSLKLSHEINYLISIRETEKILSDIYLKLNDCSTSLMHYRRYISIKDTLINESNIKQIVRIEENSKFEKEKEFAKLEQNKKDAIKQEELRHQKNQRNIFIGGFVIVLCFSVFLFLIFKKTQRQNIIITEQKKIVDENKKEVMDNINYAKRIQDAVTTHPSLVKELIPNSFVLNKPRDIVSGDFIFAETHGDEIIIAVADCTNHSVSGAMMSILCHNLLGDAITNGNYIPSDILNYVNTTISKKFHQADGNVAKKETDIVKDGMDLVLIKIDLKNMKYQFAGAYNPLLIVRKNQLFEIKADKLQIGQTKLQYTNNDGELQKDDMLYLSSDGYADQFSADGKKFMKKKFKELLVSVSQKPIDEQNSILEETNSSWRNGYEQTDDILVMGIKI